MAWRGLFPGFVPPNDTVNSKSVMGDKPADSDVMIGYQVDKCTPTWLTECFVAQQHIYSGFTGIVSAVYHSPLEPDCED